MIEWLETPMLSIDDVMFARMTDGSGWGSSSGVAMAVDSLRTRGGDLPNEGLSDNGFRIAAAIPAPSSAGMVLVAFCLAARRRRSVNGGFHEAVRDTRVDCLYGEQRTRS